MELLNPKFSILDYLVFIALLVASSLIGVFFAWKSRKNATNSEFFTGDRKLGVFPVTMSLVASFMSTNTLLGLPAEVFQIGTQYSLQIISITIAVILAAEVFMPVFYHLKLLSVHEYLEKRFESKAVRLAGTIGFLLTTCPYMAVVLYGPALALSSVTPLSITASILVVGVICTFYTAIGGIKAVIWTDVLQCILMFVGVLIVIIQGIIEVGGFGELWRINGKGGRLKFFNTKFDLYNNDSLWAIIFQTTITWSAIYCVMQTQVQRYCSMRSAQIAKRTLYYNLPGLIVFSIMSILCGMVLYAKYHDCDPITLQIIKRHDQLMPYFVLDTLSKYPGLSGLFVACVFSGSLSTLSSGFNALSAILWEDILKDRINITKEKHTVMINKLIAMGFGCLSIGMSFGVGNAGTVLQASVAIVGSMLGPLLALFSHGLFNPYSTATGTIVGLVCGISLSLILSIGSLVYPRPKVAMATSVNNCPRELMADIIHKFNAIPTSEYIESYDNPVGSAKFFHISYLYMAIIGFFTTLIIGGLMSLVIGKRNASIDPKLMSPLSKYLFPCHKVTQLYPSEEHEYNDNSVETISYQKDDRETPIIKENITSV